MSNQYLICGATGSTGSKTVAFLLETGVKVRAYVHRHDERSAALSALGAELVTGDLLDFEAVRRAMEGVKGAYFVYPVKPGILQATAYFAQAAKEVAVSAICEHVSNFRKARGEKPCGSGSLDFRAGPQLVRRTNHASATHTVCGMGPLLDRSNQDRHSAASIRFTPSIAIHRTTHPSSPDTTPDLSHGPDRLVRGFTVPPHRQE